MAADPDWTDPCAVLQWLLPQYYRVLSGQAEIRIAYKGVDTTYGQANIEALKGLKVELETECAAKTGKSAGRRRAIRFG